MQICKLNYPSLSLSLLLLYIYIHICMYSNSNRLLMNNMKGGGSKQRAMEEEMMEESPLSGAYIRNLVKQLTTSSPPPKTQHKSQLDNTPHKKQVRRRLHTTKPYQERLLNMAEARKEIVTALKFHRASMKQQQQQQQQQQQSTPPPNLFSDLPSPAAGVVLPNQTLGLSLSSFQELTNLDAACLYGRSGGSSSSTVIPSDITPSDVTPSDVGLAGSRALGDQEMEEIKSIGEMHDMEWNDTLNLANSAWWFKYLNTMEVGQQLLDFPSTHLQLPCINIEDIEALDEEWLT